MSQTTLLSSINRTTDYPITVSSTADSHCGTLQLILGSDWTNQMIHELPAINISILTADGSKFLSFDVNMSTVNEELRNKERSLTPAEPYSIAVYDIPKDITFSITPLFDQYALKAHNDLINDGNIEIFDTSDKGIVDTDSDNYSPELWTTPTSTFDITIIFDNSNVSSGGSSGGGGGDTPTAANVSYSNTTSGLSATNVQAAIDEIDNAIDNLPEPMVFKGSLGTGGTITTLPIASNDNKGFTYKVITDGTYAGQTAKIGDTFISDGTAWVLIPSGDEPSGTVTDVAVTSADGSATITGSPITSSGTIDISVVTDSALNANSTKPVQNALLSRLFTPVVDGEKKNLLQLSGKDVTGYGVKCTFDYENGTIHLDGINTDKKCTGAFNVQIAKPSMLNLVAGKTYSFTCDGYETSTTTLGLYVYTSGSGQFDTYESSQCVWVSAWNNDNSTGNNGFRLFIRQNTVIDNITLTPMICEVDEYNVSNTVVPYTSMDKRLQACMIREVDNGKKNLLMTNNGTSSVWIDVPADAPAGEYVIHFDSLESTDTDATTCLLMAFGNNFEQTSEYYYFPRGNDITKTIILNEHTSVIRLYCANSYQQSSGDTITLTNAMLCTKNDWSISTRYMPYKIDPDNTYKNLIRPTLTGNFSGNGITATAFGNGGVRISGTSTAQTVIPIGYCTLKPNTVYYAHGINGGSTTTFFLNWNWQTSASAANSNIYTSGTKINSSTSERGVYVTFYVRSGVTLDTIMFPMICSESDYLASTIYEPYVSNPDIYNNIINICYGTDLDNMRYPGTYQSPNSTISASLSNSPISGAGFILEVFNNGNTMQRLTPIAVTAGMGKYFVRSRTSSGWGDWVIFEASSQ